MSSPAVGAPVLAIIGPTAAGKSELALELAEELDAEIVNADSMQLYRGMDIGTAKLSPQERRGIPHHLLDVWPVTRTASVSDFQTMARDAMAEITARGKRVILVGGSGLYVRAALDDMDFPGTDLTIRAGWEAELALVGSGKLHQRLHTLDPAAAAVIDPGNGRKIVRALEVLELTGAPFGAVLPDPRYVVPAVQVGLDVDRPQLDDRLERRVHRMWDQGFVEEVRELESAGLRQGVTASRALGYASVLRLLADEIDDAQAREEAIRRTRRFARRQESWFRRDTRVQWLDATGPDLLAGVRSALEMQVREGVPGAE